MKKITEQEYYNFMTNSNQSHFLHNTNWAKVRNQMGWEFEYIGYEKNDKLIFAALIHYKKLPKLKSYMGYIPRGMIVDYNDEDLLKEISLGLKKYGKKNKFYVIRIDPDIKRHLIDYEKNILSKQTQVIDKLEKSGFVHQGFVEDFEGTLPRYTFRNSFADKTIDEVYNEFLPKTKKNIKTANENGVEIIEGSIDDLDEFMRIMEETGSRGGYVIRTKEFFEILFDVYHSGNFKLYFAFLNPEKFEKNIQEKEQSLLKEKEQKGLLEIPEEPSRKQKIAIKEISKQEEAINKLKNELVEIKTKYPNGRNLAASLFISEDNKSWYWYSGSSNEYRHLSPVYLLLWEYMKQSYDRGDEFFDLFGAPGNLNPETSNYGLYTFKKGFGGEYIEFIGEFDLIINKPIYKLSNYVLIKAQSSKESKMLNFILKRI